MFRTPSSAVFYCSRNNIHCRGSGFLLSAHDVITRHVVAELQGPGRLITSCYSSGLIQLFLTLFQVFAEVK